VTLEMLMSTYSNVDYTGTKTNSTKRTGALKEWRYIHSCAHAVTYPLTKHYVTQRVVTQLNELRLRSLAVNCCIGLVTAITAFWPTHSCLHYLAGQPLIATTGYLASRCCRPTLNLFSIRVSLPPV